MNKRFRLLVFDWDGTLMDSEARIVACIEQAGRELNLPALTQKTMRNVIGLGLREAINTLYPGYPIDIHRKFSECYRRHFLSLNDTPSTLFPGAAELLRSLHGRGLFLAIATGKGRNGLNRALAETGCREFFHATRCADESCSKPDPQMLLELMDELQVSTDATLMIGDTEYDLQMAANAGVRALAVSYGVHERERLLGHGPLACLNSLAQVGEWLDESLES